MRVGVREGELRHLRLASPGRDRVTTGEEIRLLHLSKHLLIQRFVVVGQAGPFLQKRQIGPKQGAHIVAKELPLNRPGSDLWPRDVCVHRVQLLLLKQGRQISRYSQCLWVKVFPRLTVRLRKQLTQLEQRRATALVRQIGFREPDDPSRPRHPLEFAHHLGPPPRCAENWWQSADSSGQTRYRRT